MSKNTNLNDLVGLAVKVRTTTECFEGAVYAIDHEHSIIVLHEPADHRNRSNFRILKMEVITQVTRHEDGKKFALPDNLKPEAPLPKLNVAKIRERAEAAAKERESKLGKDVTIQAQDIFDALNKTYKVRWDRESMHIDALDIVIDTPYTLDQCRSKSSGSNASVDRVKKVLQGEREKLDRLNAKAVS